MRKERTAKIQKGFSGLSIVAGTASAPGKISEVPSEKKKTRPEESPPLQFKPCLQCKKTIEAGYYGRWGDSGVCSKKCNQLYGKKIHPDYYKKSI